MSARDHYLDEQCEVLETPVSEQCAPQPHVERVGSDDFNADRISEASVALNSVLLATDFSKHADHALARTVMLADEIALTKAILLHVLPEPRHLPLFLGALEADDERGEDARRSLGELADRLRKQRELAVEAHVEDGSVVETIQTFESKADLLVLGAQGAHPLRDFALGSTAQRVLRKTQRPVLVVKRRAEGPYRQVLVAEDISTESSKALAYARAIAPHAMLNLVHAYHVPYEGKMRHAGVADELIEKYRAQAQAAAISKMIELISSSPSAADIRLVLAHGDAIPKLIEKEQELNADLIVVAKRDKSLTEQLLLESVTSQLLARSQCDVLVVR